MFSKLYTKTVRVTCVLRQAGPTPARCGTNTCPLRSQHLPAAVPTSARCRNKSDNKEREEVAIRVDKPTRVRFARFIYSSCGARLMVTAGLNVVAREPLLFSQPARGNLPNLLHFTTITTTIRLPVASLYSSSSLQA